MDTSKLIDNLKGMLARGQDSALLRYGLGAEYLKLGAWPEAAEHLREAVRKDPRYSAAWKLLGKALTEAGDVDQAVSAYAHGIAVAEEKGDVQAAKEMKVFLKRLERDKPSP
ncbi:MAG: tetratricopeptide repeat protein [Acidiferrobacteraceae bacterium]